MTNAPHRATYGEFAARIELELRAIERSDTLPPPAPPTAAFGSPNLTIFQWLEHILCPQLREIASGRREPPADSQVASWAARNLDGYDNTDRLLETLQTLDTVVNG